MKTSFLILFFALSATFASPLHSQDGGKWSFTDGSRLEAVLGVLRWRLYSEGGFADLPKGVTLAFDVDADPEAKGWYQVVLREFHSEDSGFDPNVAPALAHFYLRESDGKIEWYDLVEGSRRPFEDFLKDQKSQ